MLKSVVVQWRCQKKQNLRVSDHGPTKIMNGAKLEINMRRTMKMSNIGIGHRVKFLRFHVLTIPHDWSIKCLYY